MNQKNWIIIGNGANNCRQFLSTLSKEQSILALDGGYQCAEALKINTSLIIGDMDSAFTGNTQQTPIIQNCDQETTDLEKGLTYLAKKQVKTVTICCATGNEEDHTLYNLSLLKQFHNQFEQLQIINDLQSIRYHQDTTLTLHNEAGRTISLFGFPHGSVSTNALAYPLTTAHLDYFSRNSVRNRITTNQATLKITGSVLIFLSTLDSHNT